MRQTRAFSPRVRRGRRSKARGDSARDHIVTSRDARSRLSLSLLPTFFQAELHAKLITSLEFTSRIRCERFVSQRP